jgi:hypothetical protein
MEHINKLTLLIICSLLVSPYFGQLELYKSGRLNENVINDTINVTGLSSDSDLKLELWVVNSGIDSLTLFCKKTEVDVLSGTENMACWKICPASELAGENPISFVNTNGTLLSELLAPLDTNKSFTSHYIPNGFVGLSMLKYEWYDAADTTTSLASINIVFETTTVGIEQNDKLNNIVEIFTDVINGKIILEFNDINPNSIYTFQIFNLLGKREFISELNSNTTNFNFPINKLKNGLFLGLVTKDGEHIFSKKFFR